MSELIKAVELMLRATGVYEEESESSSLDIKNTPRRVAAMFQREFLLGYRPISDLDSRFTEFDPDECMKTRDLVLVKDIPFSSMCGHHMLPFYGVAHIGYLPGTKYVGLSKLPRVLDYFSKRLQTQERLAAQVADYIESRLKPAGVHVVLVAEHLCMTLRGVQKPGAKTVTASLRGKCEEPHVKEEFSRLMTLSSGSL